MIFLTVPVTVAIAISIAVAAGQTLAHIVENASKDGKLAFCQLLDTILANPDWCHTARLESKEIAETFDKSSFAKKIEDVYETVTT